ncbi:MAG: dihydrolipoyl dehydrogenase [Pseudomonadota bacterium]
MSKYNLAIIGAGPAGYVGAIRAAQLGAKVALIEKSELGGVCLNRGCIPTKAFIATAKRYKSCSDFGTFGIEMNANSVNLNFSRASDRVWQVVDNLKKGIGMLLKSREVELIKGEARFSSPDALSVDGNMIEADHYLIATGSKWIELKNLPVDGKHICTSDHALLWSELPKSILIVGGGYIGCEFASLYSAMGSEITIVEATDSILPMMEGEISKLLLRVFKKNKIKVITSTMVESATSKDDLVEVKLSSGETIRVEKVLVSVGRKSCVQGLEIENAGVELNDRGSIKVNEYLQTSNEKIYAAGDVIGGSLLAHVASHEAVRAVENILGEKQKIDMRAIPAPVFTIPEIASVGKTSKELSDSGIIFSTGKFPYLASGKAACDGERDGMAIVHLDENKKLLGAHFIGKDADLIVAEAAVAIQNELTCDEILETPHAHPTLSEVFAEALLDAKGMGMHKI